MTCISDPKFNPESFHAWLEDHFRIAVIWRIEDVQSIRPDLSDQQSWEVLQKCKKWHDAEHGINWGFIETVAGDLFPQD